MQELFSAIYNNSISYFIGGIIIGFFLGWKARK